MMDVGNANLEEGEIQDAGNISSLPNQFSLSRVTREPQRICSDESSNDNSDNSDDDSDTCSKPKKVRPLPPAPLSRPSVPNKYKVWSIALQEETLMENLTKCDVEAMDRERNVESYNYKLVDKTDDRKYKRREHHYFDDDHVRCQGDNQRKYIVGSKRRHGDMKNRLGYKKDKSYSRRLPDLNVTVEDSIEDVAEDIAKKLRESKVNLIFNVVLVLGKEKAIALYNETKGVEDNGGMLLMNGERRRTAGGVYLLLLKRDNTITSDAMKEIFADDVLEYKSTKKKLTKRRHKRKGQMLKETLIREKLLNLNTTAGVQSSESKQSQTSTAEGESNHLEEREVELHVTNPPPSPATDQDTPPSQALAYSEDETDHVVQHGVTQADNHSRTFVNYDDDDDDDDYLELGIDVDEMDVF